MNGWGWGYAGGEGAETKDARSGKMRRPAVEALPLAPKRKVHFLQQEEAGGGGSLEASGESSEEKELVLLLVPLEGRMRTNKG